MSSLLATLEVVLRFLVVLGVVIAFHELGHFVVAKALRIKVEVFSIGFGRRLFGKRIGDTDYRVALIPLGGYVRMAGDMGEEGHVPTPRDFDAKPAWARFLVMLAGPVFSLLLAVLLFSATYVAGRETPAWLLSAPVVGRLEPDSPAALAGVQVGDAVVSVDAVPTPTWDALMERVILNPGRKVHLELRRADRVVGVDVDVEARGRYRAGWIGVDHCDPVLVRSVREASPAQVAGLRVGDSILAIGDAPPCSVGGLVEALQAVKDAPTRILVVRDGVEHELLVQPTWDDEAKRYVVGIGPSEPTLLERHGLAEALAKGVAETRLQARRIVESLVKLVTFRMSMRALSGPVELAEITSEVAEEGIVPVIVLSAIISLNLAIFNLLPVPILDGGRMAMILVEAVRGRDLERRTKEWILQVGLVMIALLLVLVIWFEIIKKVEG